ncbi:uncharacterized protein BDR25DRAFT_322247 [Lindgomyces ingoldianus]|uniref:Uncharacterized protein n=1 Tax=Lindgomyces ingoldianus TaxID=673940 RepID=A0ACB6RBS1_9PLEO|nr:uncharacterized protein BDR25DRAFT_322247 [Lindgomyces ingoldianus]KAF2475790.1 hypothetical protein BDR25DRAFT_322247 [Lindgomyces ingoldianus]
MSSPHPEKISLAASSTVYTYHCLCSHLLLATTTPLPALPTRQNSLDKAHIMPLPPPPTAHSQSPRHRHAHSEPAASLDHYGLLLSATLDRKPEIVRSDDGFEKRYMQRCGRCALVVGYQLDWQQFAGERVGRREDVVFLLPGGLMTTREMVMGKKVDVEIGVGTVEVVQG